MFALVPYILLTLFPSVWHFPTTCMALLFQLCASVIFQYINMHFYLVDAV
uniref:Uncharacterized protein n=1 Tax=Octopus bimaculoides TaxID=37653 RepID=A0A0L8HA85_OCTBM